MEKKEEKERDDCMYKRQQRIVLRPIKPAKRLKGRV